MEVVLDAGTSSIDFSLAPIYSPQEIKDLQVTFTRKGMKRTLRIGHNPSGYPLVGLQHFNEIQWLSLPEMTQWTVFGANDYLIEFLYAVRPLPQKPRNILVRRFGRNDFAVFNPTAQIGENTGVLWDLTSGQRYLLADLNATEWQVVGPRKQLSLAQALHRWNRGTLEDRAKEVAAYSSISVIASIVIGGNLLLAGAPVVASVATAAVGTLSIPIFAIKNHFSFTRGQAKTMKKLESAVAAPDAVAPVAIESSLAKRFGDVISAPRAEMPVNCRIYLAGLPLSGHHILSNLDVLDARTQEEASVLLLDNLPKALQLHATICAKTFSQQARTAADERLYDQLKLIDAEAERLVQAIDAALAQQQDVFGRYLDSRIGRSELDR